MLKQRFLCFFLFIIFSSLHAKEDCRSDRIKALASLIFYLEQDNESFSLSLKEISDLWTRSRIGHLYSWSDYKQLESSLPDEKKKKLNAIKTILYHIWETEIDSDLLDNNSLVFRSKKDPNLESNIYISNSIKKKIRPYLIPLNHPMRPVLDSIFTQTRVTLDKETLKAAGFHTIANRPRSFVRVVQHPDLEGYLVKIYLDDMLEEKRRKPSWYWLVKRCEGAKKIQKVIRRKKIKYFTVPEKLIYCFPQEPSPPTSKRYTRHLALLLVTDMKLTSERRNYHAWQHKITHEHLDELFTIMSYAKGSSYRPDNIAYTKYGTFAFIDTEYPSRGPDFSSIRKYLSPNMLDYWDKLVKKGGKK